MKFGWKEDGKRVCIVCLAALMMALNIKTFVRTGGLYPGGATGLTILIQRSGRDVFRHFHSLYVSECDSECEYRSILDFGL